MLSGTVGAAFLAFGALLDRSEGLDWCRAPSGVAYADIGPSSFMRLNPGLGMACWQGLTEDPVCRTSDRPDTFLWGDSYAMHLTPALMASAPEIAMVQQTMSACAPIRGLAMRIPEHALSWARDCMDFNDAALRQAITMPGIRYVILSSRFRFLHEDVVSRAGLVAADEVHARALEEISKTVAMLRRAGKRPVFVSPPPETGWDIGKCLETAEIFGDAEDVCDFTPEEFDDYALRAQDILDDLVDIMPVIWLEEGIYPQGICDVKRDDVFIYRDAGHLSVEGSALLGKQMNLSELIRSRADAFYAEKYRKTKHD